MKKLIGGINHIGPLTIYDVALRLAARFNDSKMMPQKVYLNAGPWEAAKKMEQAGIIQTLSHIMAKADFPKEFQNLSCDEIEDLLCVMKHVCSNPKDLHKVKKPKNALFRKNLLAHKLLEDNWGKNPIPCNQLTKLSDRH